LVGCFSIEREFPTPTPGMIKNRVTTRAEMLTMVGPPVQAGLEDGNLTWTWLHVSGGAAGETLSKRLHVKFDERGVVKSYADSSSHPKELPEKMK
jgi:hypothetical protein